MVVGPTEGLRLLLLLRGRLLLELAAAAAAGAAAAAAAGRRPRGAAAAKEETVVVVAAAVRVTLAAAGPDDSDHLLRQRLLAARIAALFVPQALLVLVQLPHEVEVGADDGPARLDELVGLCHGDGVALHEVGDGDGGGARDAGVAVDEDAGAGGAGQVDEAERLLEELAQVLEGEKISLNFCVLCLSGYV